VEGGDGVGGTDADVAGVFDKQSLSVGIDTDKTEAKRRSTNSGILGESATETDGAG